MRALFALSVLALAGPALAADVHHAAWRSQAVLRAFQLEHPCPSTGKTAGRCPGYVKDHIQPLCAGGADAVENLQWQAVADAKAKDKVEWATCRRVRKEGLPSR